MSHYEHNKVTIISVYNRYGEGFTASDMKYALEHLEWIIDPDKCNYTEDFLEDVIWVDRLVFEGTTDVSNYMSEELYDAMKESPIYKGPAKEVIEKMRSSVARATSLR